ncbi:hypothetical protein ACHAWF_016160 [Thalassiosira exigua]
MATPPPPQVDQGPDGRDSSRQGANVVPQPARARRSSDAVPDQFPGERGIMRPCMNGHVTYIFTLMQHRRPHVEVGARNPRATAAWKDLYSQYFDPVNGQGRCFRSWNDPNQAWKKFKKAILAAIQGHSAGCTTSRQNGETPTPIQILAHDLQNEIDANLSRHQLERSQAAAARDEHQQRLRTAENSMGLLSPGQGVAAPNNLGFQLTQMQQQALAELGRNTLSPDGPVRPVRGAGGNDNTDPTAVANLATPAGVNTTGADANAAVNNTGNAIAANNTPGATQANAAVAANNTSNVATANHTAGATQANATATINNAVVAANRGVRANTRRGQQLQAYLAAGTVGDPVTHRPGTRTRNPDNVDVIDAMNRQMNQGIERLARLADSMQPSPDERKISRLEKAITSALERRHLMEQSGMDLTSIDQRIAQMQTKLDDLQDSLLGI